MIQFFRLFMLSCCCFTIFQLSAQQGTFDRVTNQTEKTLSPYFEVKGAENSIDGLPLKNTSARVNISGVIADVTIIQTYRNEGEVPLEAVYNFPASSNAAVYAMEMRIGQRVIKAKIKEKEEAKKEYEKAKEEGKRASLLEQQRPNVFTMNVANIMPNDEVIVTLNYTELLTPTKGIYEFVYPTVVGPRYTSERQKQTGTNDFQNPAYQKEGEEACYDFDIAVNIATPVPMQKITCNTHSIRARFPSREYASLYLDRSETNGGNRDFVLQYQLSGEQINTGVMLYEHEDENFFLMMVEPPKRIEPKNIPPREYIFINDVSGSMSGYPMDVSKGIMKDLVSNLRPEDSFNVLVFAGTSGWMADSSLVASQENIDKAIYFIDNQRGGGGTEILRALNKAMSFPRQHEELSRTFVIVTDGYVSVEKECFDLIRENNDKANTFIFGIGSSVNRYLLEGMARAGMGEPFIVYDRQQTQEQAKLFREYISNPVLTQIKLDFGKFDAYDIEPITVPDVFAERPIIVYGKYKGEPKGTIKLKGFSGKKRWTEKIDVSKAKASDENSALRYLWARNSIQRLDDYADVDYQVDNKKEITELGLKYNLLTNYTSFIAVEEVVVNENGVETVNQPVPLPRGVSEFALGFDLELEEDIDLASISLYQEINMLTDLDNNEAIIAHIENNLIKTINSCLLADSNIEGLEIKVNQKGNTTKVNYLGNNVSEELKACIESIIANWDFSQLTINSDFEFEIVF